MVNILFDDIIQSSDAPKALKSPALSDTYDYTGLLEINFHSSRRINALGIGNTDADNITIRPTVDWMTATLPVSDDWSSITYGNGKFVAVARFSNNVVYSTDGINWMVATTLSSRYWLDVVYGGGKFVAVSEYTAAYSTDGINWTTVELFDDCYFANITYGNGKFVAVDNNHGKAAYSTDGINWTKVTIPSNDIWGGITYGNGIFVAVSNSYARAIYSTDGINWTTSNTLYVSSWSGVTYGNGIFVAVSEVNESAAYSTDGINWTKVTIPSNTRPRVIAYGGGEFLTISWGAKAAYSTDGANWTTVELSDDYYFSGITYGKGKFVAVAQGADKVTITELSISPITIPLTENGLYLLPELKTNHISISCDGSYIGRLALGRAVNLKTSIPKEPTLVSTNSPRVTLSGQVIEGLGGYNYWRVSLDTRYKIDNDKLNEIIKAFPLLSKGLPMFVSFEDEKDRLPFERLYVTDTSQQELSFESSINKNLFSRRWIFEERF
jgi:hypothetical protein